MGQVCKQEGFEEDVWQIGKTKVFLKVEVHDMLEERRLQVLNAGAIMIQKVWRGYYQRKKWLQIQEATRRIQECFLSMRARISYRRMRRAAIFIQAHVRG